MLDKDKIKENLSEDDVIKIMESLGSPLERKQDDSLIFSTICHNYVGEGSDKLYYYISSQAFYCYTNCGSMDIYDIVMQSKDISGEKMCFGDAVSWVSWKSGKGHATSDSDSFFIDAGSNPYIIDDWDFLNRYKKIKDGKREPVVLPEYDPDVMYEFKPLPHISWVEEGISWKSQIKYGIRYDWRSDKIVIPHRDKSGRLVGVRGRALREEDLDRGQKYMPIFLGGEDYAHSLGNNLYGVYENREAIEKMKKIMIFEGEKSVVKCQDYFGDSNFTVAVCGGNITRAQRDIVLSMGVNEVFIAMDKEYQRHGDKASVEYMDKMLRLTHRFTPYCTVYLIWDAHGRLACQDSPADQGKDVLLQLMKEKIEVGTKTYVEDVEIEGEI